MVGTFKSRGLLAWPSFGKPDKIAVATLKETEFATYASSTRWTRQPHENHPDMCGD
jgi:hypothetical protein